jgi:hypothetical protein
MFNEGYSFVPGPFQNFLIAQQVSDTKCRYAPLPSAKEFSRASQFEINLGNLKPVGRFRHGSKALVRFRVSGITRQQQAIRFLWSASNAPAQLMEL